MRHAFAALIALTALVVAASCAPYVMRGTVRQPATPVPALTLAASDGTPFTFAALRGRIALVYFGFTSCPDLCPTTLVDLTQVKKKLGDGAAKIAVAFVTLDPERDTPSTITRYLGLFDQSFIGLTGTADQLAAARSAFGVTATRREIPTSAMGYTIDHSSFIYVIDGAGQWCEQFERGTPVDDIVSDLRQLLTKDRGM